MATPRMTLKKPSCSPAPMTAPFTFTLMPGSGLTVALIVSDVRLAALAVTVVVHGRVALPP